tara:strand:+ start:4725 stop:5240 length:516 start_codon:yes stop_codon:yes gene_type:complete
MAQAEIGSAARKRKRKASPPKTKTSSKTGLEVIEPGDTAAVVLGHENDNVGTNGLTAEHTFELDHTDSRGYVWRGRFRCHILNIRERAAVGLTRSRLTANTPAEVIDSATLNLLEMQAHLAVAIDDAPDWASDLGTLYDVGVVAAIYREVASHEAGFWKPADSDPREETDG